MEPNSKLKQFCVSFDFITIKFKYDSTDRFTNDNYIITAILSYDILYHHVINIFLSILVLINIKPINYKIRISLQSHVQL